MNLIQLKLATLCCCVFINANANSARMPGSLDTTYASTGVRLSTAASSEASRAFRDSVFHNGNTVAVGFDSSTEFTVPVLARFKDNGSSDLSFGNAGVIELPLPLGTGKKALFSSAAIVQRANHYYIVTAELGKYHVYDVNAIGSLNPVFGNAGIVTIVVPSAIPTHVDIAIQESRLIIAANGGNAANNEKQAILIGINSSNGALDGSFGLAGTGLVNTSIFSGTAASHTQSWTGLAVNPNGQIYTVGRFQESSAIGTKIMAARFSFSGVLDPSFGSAGQVEFSPSENAFGRKVVLDSRALPVIVATSCGAPSSSSCQVAAARLTLSGNIDSNWNGGQFSFARFDSDIRHTVIDVTLNTSDQPIIAGQLVKSDSTYAMLLRLRENGSLDTSFGNAVGFRIDNFGSSSPTGNVISGVSFNPLNNTLQGVGFTGQSAGGASAVGVVARHHN